MAAIDDIRAAISLNVAQLVREKWGDGALLVGLTTYDGVVTAADDSGAPGRRTHGTCPSGL